MFAAPIGDLEIGALIEATTELIPQPPLLLFDDIPGYPGGYRVASLLYGSYKRGALLFGFSPETTKLEVMRLTARKVKEAKPLPPREVSTGPVMENAREGKALDMLSFPVPRFHAGDGGRYIGTGDLIIMRSPAEGRVNMATYRVQEHEPDLLGLWISAGQQGQQICQAYWAQGKNCPVVAVFGCDPVTLLAARMRLPYGSSEMDLAGGLLERPLEVIRGPVTGLPIPAHAEIAIEGEIPPPSEEARAEGPFGEWQGYYSGGTLGTGKPQPVIRIKAVYHRKDPIIVDEAPLWFGAPREDVRLAAGLLWEQLEAAGIQDVVGVCQHTNYFVVVSIRQRYAGHAKQAAHAVLACSANAGDGRYVVIVDEDIDPTNLKEVMWAMTTRVEPTTDIEIVDTCRGTPLDPRMEPEKRKAGDFTSGRAIFYAVRPFGWRAQFPKSSRSDASLRRKMIERYKDILPFKV
jgi:4-hydroxy-3-polyprenylbenzoate decarboxylase